MGCAEATGGGGGDSSGEKGDGHDYSEEEQEEDDEPVMVKAGPKMLSGAGGCCILTRTGATSMCGNRSQQRSNMFMRTQQHVGPQLTLLLHSFSNAAWAATAAARAHAARLAAYHSAPFANTGDVVGLHQRVAARRQREHANESEGTAGRAGYLKN